MSRRLGLCLAGEFKRFYYLSVQLNVLLQICLECSFSTNSAL